MRIFSFVGNTTLGKTKSAVKHSGACKLPNQQINENKGKGKKTKNSLEIGLLGGPRRLRIFDIHTQLKRNMYFIGLFVVLGYGRNLFQAEERSR